MTDAITAPMILGDDFFTSRVEVQETKKTKTYNTDPEPIPSLLNRSLEFRSEEYNHDRRW